MSLLLNNADGWVGTRSTDFMLLPYFMWDRKLEDVFGGVGEEDLFRKDN